MIWRIFIVLALLLVAGLTLFLGKRGGVTEQAQASREPPQPGYFMTDAEIVETVVGVGYRLGLRRDA